MAAASSAGAAKSNAISDEERRWVVVGVSLFKVLTPALRDVLANEIPKWHQVLLQPPCEIDKQTSGKHEKKLPPSTLKLNYDSINNNTAHKSPRAYDYAVKDPLSLAKLFMKPFMANFTGFDQTMDASAVLSVVCEAQPFIVSGADVIAKKVRSDIRNEWAHCKFSHWTEPKFKAALQSMESLIQKLNLTPIDKTKLIDELESWKDKGLQLCFGQAVDPALLKLIKTEVVGLEESVKLWKENTEHDQEILLDSLAAIDNGLKQEIEMLKMVTENKIQELYNDLPLNQYPQSIPNLKKGAFDARNRALCQEILMHTLAAINTGFKQEIEKTKEKQKLTDNKIQELEKDLMGKYTSTCQDIETIQNKLSKVVLQSDEDIAYVFRAPHHNPWFSGRECQMQDLENVLLGKELTIGEKKVSLAAICGLGGNGKTSLVAEYAQRMKGHYQGGVFWFSGEDDTKLANSVSDIALNIGTFLPDSFDLTLSNTLDRISRIRKPWLIVVDDMDELHLSQNVMKIISGSWQQGVTGHLVITTRRKPSALANDIRVFEENCCVQLGCFDPEEAKTFLFKRTGSKCNEETDQVADSLVAELGSLPLALEQAGAYIKSLGCSLSSYLESYKTECLRLLNERKASPVSEYESQQKLAVRTTWLINFEHIKKSNGGQNAIRFLNACAFFSPNEIQQELINVGEPVLENEQFREFVGKPLGNQQVLKMLTDFSLFKKSEERCLSVHRLVQEVIQEKLTPDEKAESIVDAVRLLQYAFLKCPSPDELLSSMTDGRRQRANVNSTDPSLFYHWSKLCLHSHEICKNLERFVKQSKESTRKTVFFTETARIIYECALHLSVNCRHDEAKQTLNFAYRILDWAALGEVSKEKFYTLFPHIFPLPELVRRHILYSCKDPATTPNVVGSSSDEQIRSNSDISGDLEEMRLKGNVLFKEGCFKESIQLYSSAINIRKGTSLFDPRLVSNRASAYLKLKQYDNALKDADDYIEQCPDCWKGYARKALALDGLDDKLNAKGFAALAFYRKRSVFREYMPFSKTFVGLEECIYICDSSSHFLATLSSSSLFELAATSSKIRKVIILEPGDYVIFPRDLTSLRHMLIISCCILWGNVSKSLDSRVSLRFKGDCGLNVEGYSAVSNIDFTFDQGCCRTNFPSSSVKLRNCSFTTEHKEFPVYQVQRECRAYFYYCSFRNCKAGGLLVAGTAVVQNSICSGNGKAGLEVRGGGSLDIIDCDTFGNWQGVLIGPGSPKCSLVNSKVHDNKIEGVMVVGKSDVVLTNNRIFHNDHLGISVNYSNAIIERNEVFANCIWGIWIQTNSWCKISHNKVFSNKVGGIRVGKRQGKVGEESVIEFNEIFDNGGPGIDEKVENFDAFGMCNWDPRFMCLSDLSGCSIPGLMNAKCKENRLTNNKELTCPKSTVSTSPVKLCSYCHQEGTLQKCAKCFTAEYCGKDCQKRHWKTHRNICSFYLERSSFSIGLSLNRVDGKHETRSFCNRHHPDLEPVGPKYCNPPEQNGKRFIVKVQTTDKPFCVNLDELFVYDRSLTFYGFFVSPRLTFLVREHGHISQRRYIEKKLFFWALFCQNGKLRIFTDEFAPYQKW